MVESNLPVGRDMVDGVGECRSRISLCGLVAHQCGARTGEYGVAWGTVRVGVMERMGSSNGIGDRTRLLQFNNQVMRNPTNPPPMLMKASAAGSLGKERYRVQPLKPLSFDPDYSTQTISLRDKSAMS
jgi:hypothetical protein